MGLTVQQLWSVHLNIGFGREKRGKRKGREASSERSDVFKYALHDPEREGGEGAVRLLLPCSAASEKKRRAGRRESGPKYPRFSVHATRKEEDDVCKSSILAALPPPRCRHGGGKKKKERKGKKQPQFHFFGEMKGKKGGKLVIS